MPDRTSAIGPDELDLGSAVTWLYGLAPDDFMASRTQLAARAKAEKETGLAKAIASVRKPTVAAWVLNQLTRARPDDLTRLRELAAALHDAQEKMDGTALKQLSRQRSSLVDELVGTASEVAAEAGVTVSGPVAVQLRDTLVAALATTAAADAVGSGQLTRALSYAGFGDVDLSEATAAPPPARRPALRVVHGSGGGSAGTTSTGRRGGPARSTTVSGDDEPGTAGQPEMAEVPETAHAEPDPAVLERLSLAESRSRETMRTAATAGKTLEDAATALSELDGRIAELEESLASAKHGRLALVKAKAEAAAANKVAERTLRAALAELDQVRALLPDDEDD